jgi:hypothetical protein
MLSNIVKKITSTNVSKAKLQQIADILNIKTTKIDDSKYLSKIVSDLKRDTQSSFLEKAKAELKSDEIEVAKAKRQVKTLPKRVTKPTTEKPVVQLPVEQPQSKQVTWIEHVKKYAKEHKLSYRDALKKAKSTYVKKQKTKAPKKKPKEKKVHEYHCEFCNYKSTDKSNMNRHMKKHTDREKLLKELMSARGLIRTHKVRAEKSKNKDVRDASQAILTKALESERVIVNILKKLESGALKTGTTKTVSKKASAGTKKVPKYADGLIERMNKSYEDNNEEELGLTKAKITEFKRSGDDIIMRVKDLEVDDGEVINSIELEHDGKMDGYNVTLMQDAEIKGQMQSLEYDSFYVY